MKNSKIFIINFSASVSGDNKKWRIRPITGFYYNWLGVNDIEGDEGYYGKVVTEEDLTLFIQENHEKIFRINNIPQGEEMSTGLKSALEVAGVTFENHYCSGGWSRNSGCYEGRNYETPLTEEFNDSRYPRFMGYKL